MACQHRPNRCFQAVYDLTPKARKRFFYQSSESESAHVCISPPPGYLCRPYFIVTARTNHGNSAVSVRQSTRLGSRSGAAVVLKNSFFFLITRRHRIQPPSQAGVGFGAGIGSHVFLFNAGITRNKQSGNSRFCLFNRRKNVLHVPALTREKQKHQKNTKTPKTPPPVENFDWLPVGLISRKYKRSSVLLI